MKEDKRIPKITFDKGSTHFILGTFNKKVDSQGYIVENDTSERVLTPGGEEIHIKEFGGIKKGSEIYVKKNLTTLLKLAKSEI